MTPNLAAYIPWIPALSALLCGLCCMRRSLRVLAAPICILSIFAAFLLSVGTYLGLPETSNTINPGTVVHLFRWIHIGSLASDMAYYIDPLTIVMLFVVTGVGTLVAIYAAGYMAGDKGYARFFAYVSIFIFAMTTLVMADNLVLLYLGWEGVGLCSYLLIGYYYNKPAAVAAAKKAFIVNRIGDLGFALGIFLTFQQFGTVQFVNPNFVPGGTEIAGVFQQLAALPSGDSVVKFIPFLLMLGAFGKSAQLPLYMWLPDAMEGPTPVSALIHAATMVTAGVYMIARLFPLFALSPNALLVVAIIGAATALFAATIALCQYDIKRIWAYSTISQLGYMFLAVGVASTVGGIFHLFTHAFFKALLFLTAGSVMHAMAGQLDLRKMSGLWRKMPVTCVLMLIGCLALAGFPFTAGFYSKDMILADVMAKGLGEHGQTIYLVLAISGLVTAFLTAYYTFRLWFRVFMGPLKYEMGEEHHGAETEHGEEVEHAQEAKSEIRNPTASTAQAKSEITIEHHHEPHEMGLLMNAPLVVLAIGALLAGCVIEFTDWLPLPHMIEHSTAVIPGSHDAAGHDAKLLGLDLHLAMQIISGAIALLGIGLAKYLHWLRRDTGDKLAATYPTVVRVLANKYYVDEINDLLIVRPLRFLGEIFYIIDRMIIDGLVALVGLVPRLLGLAGSTTQRGILQGYGLGMAGGTALIVLVLFWVTR